MLRKFETSNIDMHTTKTVTKNDVKLKNSVGKKEALGYLAFLVQFLVCAVKVRQQKQYMCSMWLSH